MDSQPHEYRLILGGTAQPLEDLFVFDLSSADSATRLTRLAGVLAALALQNPDITRQRYDFELSLQPYHQERYFADAVQLNDDLEQELRVTISNYAPEGYAFGQMPAGIYGFWETL